MCIVERDRDSLSAVEREAVRAAACDFPRHAFSLLSNEDGIHWAVLEPAKPDPAMLRFTICRIDSCYLVMAEDASAQRQFCSVSTIGEAIEFLRAASDQAILAFMNAHRAPSALQ